MTEELTEEGTEKRTKEGTEQRSEKRTDDGTKERAADETAEDHLRDLPDGSGCTEIWEHIAEQRADDD